MMIEIVDRRSFFKTMAILAGAIAAGPKVLASLEEAGLAGASVASDKITYADFMNAVSYLEQHRVSSAPGGYYMILPPWLYADLMDSWDKYLREEFSIGSGMMLREISPGRAEYVSSKTGKSLGIIIVYSEAISEDETQIEWKVITEDATLTIGVGGAT